jgi:hypothetical protein
MLTGDLNVAVVEWIVQYRVSDPYRFLFKVRGLEDTFRSLNEAVMRGGEWQHLRPFHSVSVCSELAIAGFATSKAIEASRCRAR